MKGRWQGEARAATGVAGLDDILSGGLTRGHMYLVEGEPGAGKTTLALQFLMDGARNGEPVLYVSLSESAQELLFGAYSHGWDLEGVEVMELNNIDLTHDADSAYTVFDPADVELDDMLRSLREHVERIKPKRIVIDSLSEVRLLARDPLRFRREVLVLKQYFLQHETTVLLLDDCFGTSNDVQIQSLVHGVLRLERLANQFGAERRRLMVLKLRGSRFRGGFHDYRIETGGLVVFPRLVAAEHRVQALPGKVLSGVGNLDELLGGGIDTGTSSIILGPAGSGKTSIATMYALAAARSGDNAAIFLFDENIGTLLTRCRALGMSIDAAVEDGSLLLRQIDPAEMSIGEFVEHVRRLTHEGVKLIVVDSLIGLLNAMPEERMLMSQLHEMLSYLHQMGVTTIMTMAQHGLVGHMASQADLSYLADTLILLRFFEAAGEVRQAISVLKKRTGQHERTIREVRVAPGGVQVGPPLADFHGVLTGVPNYIGVREPLLQRERDERSEPQHA
ncbi:MAG TPA: ATPase domain-containing protein [Fimbriimonadaceae bacterium]|nr:ATPase domain-containing protein [Fimbriimonadaceae bacterium]